MQLGDFDAAQKIAEAFDIRKLGQALDRFAKRYCPVVRQFAVGYHWSLMQVEFATDIVFGRQRDLAPVYETITRTAVHAVKADRRHQDSPPHGSRPDQMYDKFGIVLRIETTANDVSFFKHHRKVEQRDGTTVYKLAPLKKSIYSLGDLQQLLLEANRRYVDFISSIDDPFDVTALGRRALLAGLQIREILLPRLLTANRRGHEVLLAAVSTERLID